MAKKLQLTGLNSFSSPMTYSAALSLGQIANWTDSDAASLLSLTTKHPTTNVVSNVFTLYVGADPALYDFTGESNDAAFYDGSLTILPAQLAALPYKPKRGTLLRGRDGIPYGYSDGAGSYTSATAASSGNTYLRWCIPGRDTSGVLFKDTSGRGNDAAVDASNTAAFTTDARIGTAVHASAGGVSLPLGAGLCNFVLDSGLMSFSMTNEDPAASEIVASWGVASGNWPGFYVSHRSSPAGVGRVIGNRGNGAVVSSADSALKLSNAGGTRETHIVMAWDGPSGSAYLYRDGVLAVASVGLMTGANAFTALSPLNGPRLGGNALSATVAGIFRGWQGYVFEGSGLPLNIGRVAALLAEAPSTPLRDHEFQFVVS